MDKNMNLKNHLKIPLIKTKVRPADIIKMNMNLMVLYFSGKCMTGEQRGFASKMRDELRMNGWEFSRVKGDFVEFTQVPARWGIQHYPSGNVNDMFGGGVVGDENITAKEIEQMKKDCRLGNFSRIFKTMPDVTADELED